MSTFTLAAAPRAAVLPALLALVLPGAARADAVTDWNAISSATAPVAGAPPAQARINAITHLAIHDALNSIDPRYRTYAGRVAAAPGASPEAAVATAAYATLAATVPARAEALALTYENYLDTLSCPVAYPDCLADGIDVGEAAAAAILSLRENDGSATPHAPYAEPIVPGMYQPTPGSPAPMYGNWGKVKPFALNHGAQFRSWSTLLDMNSATYAADYAEVKAVGSAAARGGDNANSSESRSVRHWAGANFNPIARAIDANRAAATGENLDLWQHARLFALLNMAQADAAITVFDGKYHYKFWRPVTAIRATDDASWTTFLSPTPPYPDYPSGLSTLTGAATEVLRRFYGTDALPYTLTFGAVERGFGTLKQAEFDAAMSRVYGGIHFRSACIDGIKQGNKVGHYVFNHYLQPL